MYTINTYNILIVVSIIDYKYRNLPIGNIGFKHFRSS